VEDVYDLHELLLASCHPVLLHAQPETKGKTLEEMDVIFGKDVKPWKSRHIQSRLQREVQEVEARLYAEGKGPSDVEVRHQGPKEG